MKIIGIALLTVAGLIAALNFYLSFVRYAVNSLFRLGEYRHVSGIPAFGTFALILGVAFLWYLPWAWWAALCIAIFDTGGLPWFAYAMLLFWIQDRRQK